MAVAVILVKVKAGKIAHDRQVKVAVAIETRERSAVNAAPAFWAQARRVRHVSEAQNHGERGKEGFDGPPRVAPSSRKRQPFRFLSSSEFG